MTPQENDKIIGSMRIGVVSDTHKNLDYLRDTVRALLDMHADLIVHLGDDYEDTEVLDEFDVVQTIRVPGVYDPEYEDRNIPHRLLENILGWKVLVSHTPGVHSNDAPGDLDPEELCARKEVDILLHGHTHVPSIAQKEGVLHFNPGHLRLQDKKGYTPSFGIIELTPHKVHARIVDFATGEDLYCETIQKQDG